MNVDFITIMIWKDLIYISILYAILIQCIEAFDFGKILGDVGRSLGIHPPEETSHRSRDEQPIYVDDKWIKSPKLDNDQIYLFAEDVNTMSWYEADDYCGKHGAFLAEPFSIEESNFLRDQANRLPDTNWWIGLRQFEKCKCTSLGRSRGSIFAFTNPDSLQFQVNSGLGSTSCPGDYQKI